MNRAIGVESDVMAVLVYDRKSVNARFGNDTKVAVVWKKSGQAVQGDC